MGTQIRPSGRPLASLDREIEVLWGAGRRSEKAEGDSHEDKFSIDCCGYVLLSVSADRFGWCAVEGDRRKAGEESRRRLRGADDGRRRQCRLWRVAQGQLYAGLRPSS